MRIVLLCFSLASLAVFLLKKFKFTFFYLALLVSFGFLIVAFVPFYPPLAKLQNPNQAQVYVLVNKAMHYINNYQSYPTIKFWYNKNEPYPYANTYQAITSTYLWDKSLIGLEYPYGLNANSVAKDELLIVLSSQPYLKNEAVKNLKSSGYNFKLLDVKEFKEDFVNFYMITGKIS